MTSASTARDVRIESTATKSGARNVINVLLLISSLRGWGRKCRRFRNAKIALALGSDDNTIGASTVDAKRNRRDANVKSRDETDARRSRVRFRLRRSVACSVGGCSGSALAKIA